jgi:hypothetical protein
MNTIRRTERVVEGEYLAEVEVQLFDDDPPGTGWGPYYTVAEMRKLESVRAALRAGDLSEASKLARMYRLTPISAA